METVDAAPVRAAGILFVTPDNRVLLLRRAGGDHNGEWAFPGGGVEGDETPEEAARRELQEETGTKFDGDLTEWTRRIADGVDFTTFLANADEFTPALNDEHDSFKWVDRVKALTPDEGANHPGVGISLLKFDLDELGIAKAIKSGELVSPQRYRNILLIALRITGTEASYRAQIDEFTWRDPSLYLNDEFLERCNGLPVIVEHPVDQKEAQKSPDEGLLNTEEFRERIAGTIMLPYIKGDEVWGIARIYDQAVAKMLCDRKRPISTSPTVESPGTKYRMKSGQKLLVEGRPTYVDSLALVEEGVWDKGGPPAGVANEGATVYSDSAVTIEPNPIEVSPMADPVATAPVAAPTVTQPDAASSADGKLDKILGHMDSLHAKCDGLAASHGELVKRMDAMEAKGAPGEGTAATEATTEPVPVMGDAAVKTGEEALEKERAETNAKLADSASRVANLEKELATVRSLMKEMPEEERSKFVEIQVQAERVAQALGDSSGQRWVTGETLPEYRRRMLTKFKVHSPDWKGADLSKVTDESALSVIEKRVYADAMHAAMNPSDLGPGELREIKKVDASGRTISTFVGSERAAWARFANPYRRGRVQRPPQQH